MKKAGNMFFKNLRYICLVGVIALGLITIVGSNGDDNKDEKLTRTTWTIIGNIQAKAGYQLDTESGLVKIGGFSHNSSYYTPDVDNIEPDAGYATVNSDGSFSLSINTQGITVGYIHIFVWYDADDNNKLDAITEAFDQPEESVSFGGDNCYYDYDSWDDEQWENGYDYTAATDISDADMYVDENLTN